MILWSGGVDSTYALDCLLRPHINDTKYWRVKDEVRALSINVGQVPSDEQQKKARQAIKAYYKKKYGIKFKHTEWNLNTKEMHQNTGIIQPVIWIPLACTYLLRKEKLYASYVREDVIWHYKKQLMRMFKSCRNMMDKKGALELPFEFWAKAQIIKSFRQRDSALLDMTWHCESPEEQVKLRRATRKKLANGIAEKPCRKCGSCEAHQTALWQLRQKHY